MHPFHEGGGVTIYRANALALPLPDESVDLIITSPPYFGLRSYEDGGEHYTGQIGAEATPVEFLDALIAATREMVRVLRPSGSIFVNLGDKYVRSGKGKRRQEDGGIPRKSLMLLPERYRIRCVDELGLIARLVIEWEKAGGLPDNATDRLRRTHEEWVHLTKEPDYFAAVDEVREPVVGQPALLGKLPGSVLRVPSQPLTAPQMYGVANGRVAAYFSTRVDAEVWLRDGTAPERRSIRPLSEHYAAFPMDWPRRFVLGWAPTAGICTACGEGRRPVTVKTATGKSMGHADMGGRWDSARINHFEENARRGMYARGAWARDVTYAITGYKCGCDEPTAPTMRARVLDTFGGTGTTAMVAAALGCDGISVDLSESYCRLARWRVGDPAERARAHGEKPRPRKIRPISKAQANDKPDLFSGDGELAS